MKLHKILILSSVWIQLSLAQEGIRPLNSNINLYYGEPIQAKSGSNPLQAKKSGSSLEIPFKDDFYYAMWSNFPDQTLWSDSGTYVNTGHAIAPPSIGVATFDGLNKKGHPYQPNLINLSSTQPADTLTSKPINLGVVGTQTLQPSDSLALIFYYEARGFGDSPELIDSLIVDFYRPLGIPLTGTTLGTWDSRVWYTRGNPDANTNDTIFKRAFLWISDTAYLHDGFKFRIRNKATVAGDFDQWHVDYVYLNKQRSMLADTSIYDKAFGYVPTPLLKDYSSMPWHQYQAGDRADNLSVFIRNNSDNGSFPNISYGFGVYDPTSLVYTYTANANPNFKSFKYFGWSDYSYHSYPGFTHSFSNFTDSVDFRVRHRVYGGTTDFYPANDTVIQYQRFRNYFAYDDGSAEAAYYVYGAGGKMTLKFKLNTSDTLRAVRIYFDPMGSLPSITSGYFNLQVYSSQSGMPGTLLLQDSSWHPAYLQKGVNVFPEYKLTSPMILPAGEYFIGIKQKIASGIGVGFDRNLNHSDQLFFDSGNGWTPSNIRGSLMIRPVVGRKIIPPVGVMEKQKTESAFTIFPNPAHSAVNIVSNGYHPFYYKLMNMLGQVITENQTSESYHQIETTHLSDGVYLLQLSDLSGKILLQRICITH